MCYQLQKIVKYFHIRNYSYKFNSLFIKTKIMKNHHCNLLIFVLFLFIATPGKAQTEINRLDTFFNALNADGKINGNVLVAEHGKVIFSRSFGYADITAQQKNTDQTRFNLASASKPFTAVAIFVLLEKGKLRLDDKVSNYLTGFPFQEITIRHLLSHTSGLPNTEELFTPLLKRDSGHIVTNADVIPELKSYGKPLHFIPGEKYEYGNTEYSLLALIIEKIGKKPFATFLQQQVFDKVGMQHTSVQGSNQALQAIRYIKPFVYSNEVKPVNQVADLRKWTYNWAGLTGQGNIISTTGDMLLFDQALYSGKLLKKSSLDQMFTPVKLNNGTVPYFRAGIDEAAYGLGWFIYKDTTNGKIVWHSGGIPGMNTFFLRNLNKKQLIVTMDNTQNATIAPETYIILSGKSFSYKRSVALAYVDELMKHGTDDALTLLHILKSDGNYLLNEGELNFFGLKLFDDRHTSEALEVLRINTLLFPASFNVYDSYAEVLLKTGKKAAAATMYRKSLDLNPQNEGARKVLEQLKKK